MGQSSPLFATAQWSQVNACPEVPNFTIVDEGFSDLSSDADSDGSLGPGPPKAQSTSGSADMMHDEEPLEITSHDDQSLSEVELLFMHKLHQCMTYTILDECSDHGCQETWVSDEESDLEN